MARRPERISVKNELGRATTLAEGPAQFTRTGSGKVHLFLGLGPRPDRLGEYFPGVRQARYIESPEFAEQMATQSGGAWSKGIPSGFTPLAPEELTPALIRQATIYRYLQGPRLFPGFWGPIWARCALPHLDKAPWPDRPVVWLPGEETGLLSRELALAFGARDWKVRWIPPHAPNSPGEESLPWQLAKQRPSLFLSINFKGLDSHGHIFYYLRQAGCRVAVWFVDNPFHVLTGAKANFWKEMDLFVTDSSFIEPLTTLGAQSVHHLPLATSPALFSKPQGELPPEASDIDRKLVFVGRTAFPGKREFFAGVRLEEGVWNTARTMLSLGDRPDFFWWAKQLGVNELWPGNAVRRAGLGAEESGLAWRSLCLDAALRALGEKLAVFGDEGWGDILPGADLRRPVDYYGVLPRIYARTGPGLGACLNMTSPLLPAGLTQRHFDVWCAGGLLLTDNTPGLDIFPDDLVEPVRFTRASEIPALFAELTEARLTRERLISAWRRHILDAHTYGHRVGKVLDILGL